MFNIRVVHGCPGGAVTSDGPGEEDDAVWLESQAMNGILHDSINGVLFCVWEWHSLSSKKWKRKKVKLSPVLWIIKRTVVNPIYPHLFFFFLQGQFIRPSIHRPSHFSAICLISCLWHDSRTLVLRKKTTKKRKNMQKCYHRGVVLGQRFICKNIC